MNHQLSAQKERPLNDLTVTPYQRRNRHAVRDLIFRSYRTHTHLDWHETDQWLEEGERYPMRLVWQNQRLQGVLATSEPLDGTCWVRIAALTDHGDPQPTMRLLWSSLTADLRARGVRTVALLLIRNWLAAYMTALGFTFSEEIITFRRPPAMIPATVPPEDVRIRLTEPRDLPTLITVDHAAFAPLWQMENNEIRQAERISAACTVAEVGTEMVGYQLSTLYFDGAHLARLAVVPKLQGNGIARALLADVLQRFERRGVRAMTVNTQASNLRSQRLYTGFGFERNGYDLPVWIAHLDGDNGQHG